MLTYLLLSVQTLYIYFFILYACVCVCVPAGLCVHHMPAGAFRGQEGALEPLELELETIMSHLGRVPGPKPRSSGRALVL